MQSEYHRNIARVATIPAKLATGPEKICVHLAVSMVIVAQLIIECPCLENVFVPRIQLK
jgi:hypothetical protein